MKFGRRKTECHCSLDGISGTLTSETFVESAAQYQQLDDVVHDLLKDAGIPPLMNFYQACCK